MKYRLSKTTLAAVLLSTAALLIAACAPILQALPAVPAPAAVDAEPAPINVTIPGVPEEAVLLFTENCSTCHGPTGEGTGIAPPLKSAELRTRLDDAAIKQTITFGRPGTAMPVWGEQLSEQEIDALVSLIRNWDKMDPRQAEQLAEAGIACSQGMGPGMGMGSGMGMHRGMGGGGPMMGTGCPSKSPSPQR